jgi:hypothetical protein
VELDREDPLTRLWLGVGWGRSWGILIDSPAPLATVRRRMRHFTLARLPDGTGPVMFRFWDPRVFRTYLPLAEPTDLTEWFKDIDRFLVESEDGGGSLVFGLRNGALQQSGAARPLAGVI